MSGYKKMWHINTVEYYSDAQKYITALPDNMHATGWYYAK